MDQGSWAQKIANGTLPTAVYQAHFLFSFLLYFLYLIHLIILLTQKINSFLYKILKSIFIKLDLGFFNQKLI